MWLCDVVSRFYLQIKSSAFFFSSYFNVTKYFHANLYYNDLL